MDYLESERQEASVRLHALLPVFFEIANGAPPGALKDFVSKQISEAQADLKWAQEQLRAAATTYAMVDKAKP